MSSTPLLLDTNILLEIVRDKDLGKRISSQFNLADATHRPLISIVTVGEIWTLADEFSFGQPKRDFLERVLDTVVILDINHDSVIEAYVAVNKSCRNAAGGRRTLSKNDIWIAATAIAAGAMIVTTDKDFVFLNPDPCRIHYVDPILPKSAERS